MKEEMEKVENENKAIVQRASAYAREHITAGSTWVVNNTYPPERREELETKMSALRDKTSQSDLSGTIDQGVNKVISKFQRTIRLCRELHIGNCHELAEMALHYMIQETDTYAEVYTVGPEGREDPFAVGKHHVFLVIGRAIPSDPSNPETWGNNAYICDPWSNAEEKIRNLNEKAETWQSPSPK